MGIAGETLTLSVPVNHDTKVEADETFRVALGSVSGTSPSSIASSVALPTSGGDGSIVNDDDAALSVEGAVVFEGDAGSAALVFTVTLNAAVDTGLSVDFHSIDGTATVADSDYAPSSGTLLFAGHAFETQTLSVPINGDETVELDETFAVVLSGLAAAGRTVSIDNTNGTGTIRNDDIAFVTVDSVSSFEGNAGSSPFLFTATVDKAVDVPYSLDVYTQDGTATATDGDFAATTITLHFAGQAGETQVFGIEVFGDLKVELDELFSIGKRNFQTQGRHVFQAANSSSGIIRNDDSALISVDDIAVPEADAGSSPAMFSVTLSAPVDHDVTVFYSTADGSAQVADADYTAIGTASVTFVAGSAAGATQPLAVQIGGDETVERDEDFRVNLTSLVSGGRDVSIGDNQAAGTIINDDSASITVSDVSSEETDVGSQLFTFVVSLEPTRMLL